jgi:hypothetical protein
MFVKVFFKDLMKTISESSLPDLTDFLPILKCHLNYLMAKMKLHNKPYFNKMTKIHKNKKSLKSVNLYQLLSTITPLNANKFLPKTPSMLMKKELDIWPSTETFFLLPPLMAVALSGLLQMPLRIKYLLKKIKKMKLLILRILILLVLHLLLKKHLYAEINNENIFKKKKKCFL